MPEVRFILHVPASDEYLLHADTAVYRYCSAPQAPPHSGDDPRAATERPAAGRPVPRTGNVGRDDLDQLLG